jgi:hypothetical protein
MLRTAPFKLAYGSHSTDDPDNGVCLVEAAIIATGFERREVRRAQDCPPCFSRVLAQYAIRLNDGMPDDLRNELLLPFVTRLAGTADGEHLESARASFIAVRTVNTIHAPILYNMPGFVSAARQCQSVIHIREILSLLLPIQSPATRTDLVAKSIRCIINAAIEARSSPSLSANCSGHAAISASKAVLSPRTLWAIATDILDGAIKLGNLSPAENMPAWRASMTNMKPTTLAAVPGEKLTGNSNSHDISVRRPSRPPGPAVVEVY